MPTGVPLEIRSLSKSFGQIAAVSDLSVTVPPGQVTGWLALEAASFHPGRSRQRFGLAIALLGDSAVLVLAEPVNGLDPDGVRWIRGLLRALAAEGRTVLVSSHLLSEVHVLLTIAPVRVSGR